MWGGGGGNPITLKVEATQTANQIKITPTTDLNYSTTYQLTIKEGLTIGNYRVTNDITYPITTEKRSDSSLIVLHNHQEFFPNGNNITILFAGSDVSSVSVTLEVGEGATLQDGNNNDLPLNENRQYSTNMDFSGGGAHDFKVTAQDGITSTTYTIGVLQQRTDSKEILSFAFRETDHLHLKADIVMDVNTNNQTVTKTVTNVEGITSLIPTINHSGSGISPASGVAQDFSTDNTYTVTAIDGTTSTYTVTLTNYYGVTININGGRITGAPTTTEYILYGEKAIPPSDPYQAYYGFKGWYDAPSGGNVFDFTTDITTKTTVYAQWTNKQYKVSFETYAGTSIPPVTVKSLTPIARPVDPTSEHYSSFEGWYTDDTFTTRYDFNQKVYGSFTLYAKYIHKHYQVRFYQGANLLDTVSVAGATAILASNYPTPSIEKQLYKWYSDSGLVNIYDKNSLVVGNLDLYAKVLTTDGTFKSIIENGIIPSDLANYDDMSETIFSYYIAGADVIPRYVKETGNGNSDGSSWDNASGDIKAVVDGINDASENKVYVVLVASGTYKPANSYFMKNHVALIGGFTAGSYDRSGETYLDGDNDKSVFYNDGLDRTALLYGVIITNGNTAYNGGGMFNHNSSPTLISVTFSGNTANQSGGGMYNLAFSSPTLNNVTFSSNTANQSGGGMYNFFSSSPTLINVTFSGNTANQRGGGIYHNSDGHPLTLINTILWGNNNGNIYLRNDNHLPESMNLYYSLIEGGITPSTTATGIRLQFSDTNTNPININSEEVITGDPGLGPLADYGGGIDTISIGSGSPAKDKGIYVMGVKSETGNLYPEANLYYSKNNTDWYSDPGLTTQENPPSDADDLTATDARGYGRVDRPDMGAYEEGGTAP